MKTNDLPEKNDCQMAILDNALLAIFTTDANGLIQTFNPAAEKLLGYKAAEINGRATPLLFHDHDELKQLTENSGNTPAASGTGLFAETIQHLNMKTSEWIFVRKNGTRFPVKISYSPVVDTNGETKGFMCIMIDNTHEKQVIDTLMQREAYLSAIIENQPGIVWLKDTESRFLATNEAFARSCGAQSKEHLVGKTDFDIWPPDLAKMYRDDDIKVMHSRKHYKVEEPIFDMGETKWFETFKTPVFNELGEIIGTSGYAIDVTERKRAEEEIVKAKNEAETANKAKSEFLSRISHELRTPLNSILGFAQLLEMSDQNPQHQKAIRHILNSGRHLLGLINEVLNISQIEAGQLALAIGPVQINDIITEMVDIMHHFAEKHKITIEKPEISQNHFVVSADPLRLRQVLLNLLSNAIKYNTEGGSVHIETSVTENNGNGKPYIRVLIKDTGIGISKENLSKIFLPFERTGAEKTTTEGTGLGLAVVKGLIEIMNGHIGVESEPGKGAAFWIELPADEGTGEVQHDNKEVIMNVPETREHNGTILYIEDNIPNLHLVDNTLKNHRKNVKLISGANGNDALSLALQHNPGLILLDLNLPDIHGSEVFEILKANEKTRNIPVVIISADAMPQQIDKLMKAGAKHYLTKPIKIAEFIQTIDKYLN